jgi:hypothetical protein
MQKDYMLSFLRKTYLWLLAVPLLCTVLGATSNQIVLIANHDTFPVSVNLVRVQREQDIITLPDGTRMLDDVHCIASDKTHLNLMADIIDFGGNYLSIGDLLLYLGEWLWTFMPFVYVFAVTRKVMEE